MYELSDAIIVIPVRIDQPKRLANLERNIAFLNAHLNVEICVIEQDSEPHVPSSLNPMFIRDGDTFHKSKLFNIAVQRSIRQVCFFLDVDILVDPEAYKQAYDRLSSNTSDVCLLYTRNNPTYQYVDFEPTILAESSPMKWMGLLKESTGVLASCEGGIVAFRRDKFQSIGGFNERFIGYGHEDSEIITRAKKFGLRYQELPFSIYHQTHDALFMVHGIQTGYKSLYIENFTRSKSASILQTEFIPTHPKFVTLKPSGGRLGNLLFEVAALFQYAKQTCRIPFISIPPSYSSFLQPLIARMTYPSPNLERKTIRSVGCKDATFYTEFPLVFDDTPILELEGGYLQSPEMFRDVKWMIQDLLGSKESPYPETRVMVHVRRGDYKYHAHTYEQLGDLYYRRSMTYMKQKIPSCTFVVFSDEPAVVRTYQCFQRKDVEFFDDTGMDSTAVLQEMSRYQSFILANSTFGLWSALLSKCASTVVAPLHWSRIDSPDNLGFWNTIYDPSWIRIGNHPLTILSDDSQFDLFRPADGSTADIAIYTKSIPSVSPNAHIVAVVTNHAETYVYSERSPCVDYIFSSSMKHLNLLHPSWRDRPVVYVGTPGTLEFFHYIQTVTETLRDRPIISVLLSNSPDDRPGTIFQTLHSIYRQTDKSWEILFPYLNGGVVAGEHALRFLAIPKLLCVLVTGSSVGQTTRYARTTLIAYAKAGTLLTRRRFEVQRSAVKPHSICATNYIDYTGNRSVIPYAISSLLGSVQDPNTLRNTFMFYKQRLNSDQTFDLSTHIQVLSETGVVHFGETYPVPKTDGKAKLQVLGPDQPQKVNLITGIVPELKPVRYQPSLRTHNVQIPGLKYLA